MGVVGWIDPWLTPSRLFSHSPTTQQTVLSTMPPAAGSAGRGAAGSGGKVNLQKALKYFSLAGAPSFVMNCGDVCLCGWVYVCSCVGSQVKVGAHSFPLRPPPTHAHSAIGAHGRAAQGGPDVRPGHRHRPLLRHRRARLQGALLGMHACTPTHVGDGWMEGRGFLVSVDVRWVCHVLSFRPVFSHTSPTNAD